MQAIRSMKFNRLLSVALVSASTILATSAMAQTTPESLSLPAVMATEEMTPEATAADPLSSEEASSEGALDPSPSIPEEMPPEVEKPMVEDPTSETETEAEVASPVDTSTLTIVEVASSSEAFEILSIALNAAELTDELSGEGPFTVFAPTDEAFESLPEGVLDTLLLPENQDLLVKILTYHVVAEAVRSEDIATHGMTTLEGNDLEVMVEDSIKVNEATILLADVEASNGIIHVIDQVMIPPELAATLPTATVEASAVSEVVQ
jgi:uncharacterized surface protein with fasciclin (FAS1) repeats